MRVSTSFANPSTGSKFGAPRSRIRSQSSTLTPTFDRRVSAARRVKKLRRTSNRGNNSSFDTRCAGPSTLGSHNGRVFCQESRQPEERQAWKSVPKRARWSSNGLRQPACRYRSGHRGLPSPLILAFGLPPTGSEAHRTKLPRIDVSRCARFRKYQMSNDFFYGRQDVGAHALTSCNSRFSGRGVDCREAVVYNSESRRPRYRKRP